jgi:RHS repeat-associated protein
MPAPTREILLSRYHYDPLDRLVDCTPFDQAAIQRFYCKTRLICEIQGTVQRTVMQHEDQLLAQQQREGGKVAATLLATDQQRSVLNALDANQPNPFAYSPYGHRPPANGLLSLLGFNGERPDPVTGHYHLGNGYRQFNPVLMRFNSPDSLSPFGKGGLNAYGYCSGDPVNQNDPTGHIKVPIPTFDKIFKSAHEFVTNRKTYRPGHFADATREVIKDFGGREKFELLAETTKTDPDAIIAKILVERGRPSRFVRFDKGEDVNEYLEKLSTHISKLAAQRNTNRELLKTKKYSQHLNTRELEHLSLNQKDVKKELSSSINYSLQFRGPGHDTADFNVEKWNQAAIRKGIQ